MTTTNDPINLSAELSSVSGITETEAAARVAARPVEFSPFSDDRSERFIAAPPDWSIVPVEPEPFRVAPDLQKGNYLAVTADGFVTLVDQLSAPDVAPRLVADKASLTAVLDPGALASPSFEHLRAVLRPEVSDELTEWLQASKPHKLDQWGRFVEDHIVDIDAAAEHDNSARTSAEVLNDARTWNVEARRAVRRIRTELSEADDVDEYKATVVGGALASFKIQVPVLRFGEPVTLTVALTRDLEAETIAPRLPGIQRVIDAAELAEITRAETTLNLDVIR